MRRVINDIEIGGRVWILPLIGMGNKPVQVIVGDVSDSLDTLMPRKDATMLDGSEIYSGLFVNQECWDTEEEANVEFEKKEQAKREADNYRRNFYRGAARAFLVVKDREFKTEDERTAYIDGYVDACMRMHKDRGLRV